MSEHGNGGKPAAFRQKHYYTTAGQGLLRSSSGKAGAATDAGAVYGLSSRDGRRFLNSRQGTAQKCRFQTHLIAGVAGRHPSDQNFTCVKPLWHSSHVSLFKVTSSLNTFSLHRMLLVLRKHKNTKWIPLNQAPTFPKRIGFESGQHSPLTHQSSRK